MRFFLLLMLALQAAAQQTPAPRRPKLVVALCIDQFRYDYLIRFRDQYNGGLARLTRDGAVFTNAYYDHFPTVTAIGHSTFLSGATPSVSGIVGNEWYDRETGKQVTSVSDTKETMLGGAGRSGSGAASPRRMLVSTVGDELKMAGRDTKVVGVSVKDRSAILPAGHMSNGAYWFDPGSGNFVSSTFYFKELPGWVQDFNRTRFVDKFLNLEWTPLAGGTAFRKMPAKADTAYYNSLESTPYGNDIVIQFAQAAVLGEGLGKRAGADVLAVSLSSNDYVGHANGPDSAHVRDVSIRTDRLLADFFKFLDAHVGMRNVVVVMTADHGVAPVPEVNQERRMPGGRITDITARLEAALVARYGGGKWIVGRSGVSPYLNHELIAQKNLTPAEVADFVAESARGIPHVFRAYSRYRLVNGQAPGDQVDRRILNGFHYQRSADVLIVADPYYLFEAKGTSHGMPFGYDAHVPVIFMGPGVKAGQYHRRAAVNDIAPTLATMLEVETPSGSVGRVLDEMLTAPPRIVAR
jgi:predicted AlkP superfamily pyrophosphatase or phosphodiesterase